MSVPCAEMLETPPGYPFEEIDYADIEVEEVRDHSTPLDLFIIANKASFFVFYSLKCAHVF